MIELIRQHVSVRSYRPDPVSSERVEEIVGAAQHSSTSSNLQLYRVIAVTDADKRQQLAVLCGNQAHVAEAPVFLAWCADLWRLDLVCRKRGYTQVVDYVENFLVAAVDVAIASQSAALAAESMGLGICYIGAIRNHPRRVIELLNLPRLVFPVTGMTLGWPAGTSPPKPRLPSSAVLHWDHYERRGEDEAVKAYDRTMAQSGIYQGRQVPMPGSDGELEDYGWMEHSARRVSQPYRTELRRILEEQGISLR